jgi:hypothetical protein
MSIVPATALTLLKALGVLVAGVAETHGVNIPHLPIPGLS